MKVGLVPPFGVSQAARLLSNGDEIMRLTKCVCVHEYGIWYQLLGEMSEVTY